MEERLASVVGCIAMAFQSELLSSIVADRPPLRDQARTLGKRVWRCPWRGHATRRLETSYRVAEVPQGTRRYCRLYCGSAGPEGGAHPGVAHRSVRVPGNFCQVVWPAFFNAVPSKPARAARRASGRDLTKSASLDAMRGTVSPPEAGGGRNHGLCLTFSGKMHLRVRPNPGSGT